jgi:hypothetical protein
MAIPKAELTLAAQYIQMECITVNKVSWHDQHQSARMAMSPSSMLVVPWSRHTKHTATYLVDSIDRLVS